MLIFYVCIPLESQRKVFAGLNSTYLSCYRISFLFVTRMRFAAISVVLHCCLPSIDVFRVVPNPEHDQGKKVEDFASIPR